MIRAPVARSAFPMSQHWRKPLSVVLSVALLGGLLGFVVGAVWALGVVALLLAALLVHHLRNLSQFQHWLLDPRLDNIPVGSGQWEQSFSYLLRMRRRQAQTEARLHEALTRFQKAGAAIPEAVVILDPENRIDWCNPSAQVFFGLDPVRDRGQQINYLMRQPQFLDYLGGDDWTAPLQMRFATAAGQEANLSVQLVPYGENEKLLLGRDVTRWERLETTRRDFVANVSHELRTPLTVLMGFLETLSDMRRPDPEMTQRSLRLMTQQTVRMSRLVEDLLTLSRLESTNAPFKEETVHVPELVQHLHQDALALSNGRHTFHVRLATHDALHGSTDEIRSALGNLVSNAIRYTPEGGTITLAWALRDSDAALVFSVIDTGIGIEQQHIERLTERFYRVDRSRSRETGGTGLGLAIVKHVLSRHQAHLQVHSEPGAGSTFSAVFPPERRVAAETLATLDGDNGAAPRREAGQAATAA
jgi:two-component system phosphate regulon sensor histidine kinase PhoR